MITALDLRNQMAFALDAENSDHYRDDLDYIPAINGSIRWLTNVVSKVLGQDKFGEEFFSEISYSGVFQTSEHSRISLNVFPNEVWSILAVYPLPDTDNSGLPVVLTPDVTRSYYRSDLLFVSSKYDCKRLNAEEWSKNKTNPFEAGYEGSSLCGDLISYAYLNPINHLNTNLGVKSQEIEIRPTLNNKNAAVLWAKKPSVITDINDVIEFPDSCFQLLFDKALSYISYKQGDNTTIYEVSERDIQMLLGVVQ